MQNPSGRRKGTLNGALHLSLSWPLPLVGVSGHLTDFLAAANPCTMAKPKREKPAAQKLFQRGGGMTPSTQSKEGHTFQFCTPRLISTIHQRDTFQKAGQLLAFINKSAGPKSHLIAYILPVLIHTLSFQGRPSSTDQGPQAKDNMGLLRSLIPELIPEGRKSEGVGLIRVKATLASLIDFYGHYPFLPPPPGESADPYHPHPRLPSNKETFPEASCARREQVTLNPLCGDCSLILIC